MCDNGTLVTEFFMVAFKVDSEFKIPLFCLFLGIYIVILVGNVLIILFVSTCHHLKVPMYLFLRNLSMIDLLLTTNIIPNMLYVLLREGANISVASCFIQYYIFGCSTFTQTLVLTSMAFDRYLAICYPLRYSSIMNQKLCLHLVCWPWAICFSLYMIEIITLFQINFCGSNIIELFYCDFTPILAIATADMTTVMTEDFAVCMPIMFFAFTFVTASYCGIFTSILKIKTNSGRRKAFSTCGSHLTTIAFFFGSQIAIYVFPVRDYTTQTVNYLFYTILTPFMNPIIYSMRNKEIKKAAHQLFYKNNHIMSPMLR